MRRGTLLEMTTVDMLFLLAVVLTALGEERMGKR